MNTTLINTVLVATLMLTTIGVVRTGGTEEGTGVFPAMATWLLLAALLAWQGWGWTL